MASHTTRRQSLGLVAGAYLAVQCLDAGPGFITASMKEVRVVSSPGEAVNAARSSEASSSVPSSSSAATMAVGVVALVATAKGLNIAARRRHREGDRDSRIVLQARGGAQAPLVVIAGPPAAGKGTQCDKIKAKFGYVHLSTGDMLRENVKNGTELGKKAKSYMDSGALVPSELIVDIVKDRLNQPDVKEHGCLLDGFPRAPDQALAMQEAGLKVSKFLVIKVPDETLVERGCGRRLDPQTGDIYHLKFKPPPADIVSRLVHRSDDQEEAIRARLKIYHEQVGGITPYFKDVVVEVDGTGKPDEVFAVVDQELSKM